MCVTKSRHPKVFFGGRVGGFISAVVKENNKSGFITAEAAIKMEDASEILKKRSLH